jgi:hypothetical protein
MSGTARRLQLRGQPRLWGEPSPRSLLDPAGAGTDDSPTITGAGTTASRKEALGYKGDIDKGRTAPVKWRPSTVSQSESE